MCCITVLVHCIIKSFSGKLVHLMTMGYCFTLIHYHKMDCFTFQVHLAYLIHSKIVGVWQAWVIAVLMVFNSWFIYLVVVILDSYVTYLYWSSLKLWFTHMWCMLFHTLVHFYPWLLYHKDTLLNLGYLCSKGHYNDKC